MKKILLTTAIILTATFASAGEPEIRNCGDGYLGSETYFYDCKALVLNEFWEGVDTKGKTNAELHEMQYKYWLTLPRKNTYCAYVLGVSASDFLKTQECYND